MEGEKSVAHNAAGDSNDAQKNYAPTNRRDLARPQNR